jgi:sRNA-binding protein
MFIEEYDINPNSFTELLMVNELVECELMLWRINSNLSKPEYAELVNENPVGVDKDGNPITKLEINALFEARERINTRKSRVIKLMVGDREGKGKMAALLKKSDDKDPSKQASSLRTQMDALQAKAKMLEVKLEETHKETLSPEDLLEEVDE